MLYCLICSGIPLSAEMCDKLYYTARTLYRDKPAHVNVTGQGFEGRVSTANSHESLGSIAGVVFHARLETDIGDTKASFIIPEGELPSATARWYTETPDGDMLDLGRSDEYVN